MASYSNVRALSTIDEVKSNISCINSERFFCPFSILRRSNSISPVSSTLERVSIGIRLKTSTKRIPFDVALKDLPKRLTYSLAIKFSIISARVAGVPIPLSLRTSAISSSAMERPQCSIKESNFASVRRAGGFVAFV